MRTRAVRFVRLAHPTAGAHLLGTMSDATARLADALADRYRIERELGAGGMATVYLATDLKHGRKVAIKVLRPELSAVLGSERFLKEIELTASLQHPNILPLFDSGSAEGLLFYVMPFIEGETLRARLTREHQLPIPEAVRIAKEVASALDYAHRQHVIHRDIKPENILLHDGRALVADFGIALAASRAGGERMTETGLSLGTPVYMSPEQAMGEREITARSDVYALGAVTYEMLLGDPPFSGSTGQAIVARVITEPPRPLAPRRHTIPAHVEVAVLTALEKLPADRFGSAKEFSDALDEGRTHARTPSRRDRAPAVLATITALSLLAAAWGWLRPRPPPVPPPVYRFNVTLPLDATWVGDFFSNPALSPDGTLLAYSGRDSTDRRRLYLRAMDRLDPVPVAGSENATNAFFSPDGRQVGFALDTRIVRAPVAGGTPETVCDAGNVRATWLERNTVVFTDGIGLRECTMLGALSTLLASDSTEKFGHAHGLPGDRGVLFGIQRGATSHLAVFDLRTSKVKPLDILGTNPRYVDTGHLVYVGPDRRLRAVRFDLARLAPAGEAIILEEGIAVEFGAAVMALSRTGTIVAPSSASSQRTLELVDRNGRAERLVPRLGAYFDPRFSPDGRRLAITVGTDIWLLDRFQGTLTRLSFDSSASRPVWSRDGRQVAYVREIGVVADLRRMIADGSSPAESLLTLPGIGLWEVLFAPGGRSLVVRTAVPRDILLLALDSASPPSPLLKSLADEVAPAVSPDGRWMAYVSNESGRAEVYVRSFPGMQARTQISLDGGTEPVWSPTGNELFYRSGPALLAAEVRAGSTFEIVHRVPLFASADFAADQTHAVYDVAPDGRHFVMVRNLGGTSHLKITLNLFQNLPTPLQAPSRKAPSR